MHVCMRTRVCATACVHVCVGVYVRAYVRVCECVYVREYVCVCVCTCVCVVIPYCGMHCAVCGAQIELAGHCVKARCRPEHIGALRHFLLDCHPNW